MLAQFVKDGLQSLSLRFNEEKLRNCTLCTTRFFHKQHFYQQHQAEIGKNQTKAKQHPESELLLFEN